MGLPTIGLSIACIVIIGLSIETSVQDGEIIQSNLDSRPDNYNFSGAGKSLHLTLYMSPVKGVNSLLGHFVCPDNKAGHFVLCTEYPVIKTLS